MGSSSFPKLYGYEVARLLAKRVVGLSGMPAAITSASRCANWDVVALVSRSQRLLYAAQSTLSLVLRVEAAHLRRSCVRDRNLNSERAIGLRD